MAYESHSVFSVSDWGTPVWRYISLPQLLSLLERESLYFSQADSFEDPFEGTLPKSNREEMQRELGDPSVPEKAVMLRDDMGPRYKIGYENMATRIEFYRRISYLNCWNALDHESVAMWKANLDSRHGAVVKSSAENLRDAFQTYDENQVFIGEVEYIDYEEEEIPYDNLLYPFIYKRKGFKHENELRAIITSPPLEGYPEFEGKMHGQEMPLDWQSQKTGMYVQVDVEELVDEVRLSPNSPGWYRPLLESVIEKYDFDIPVNRSALNVTPDELT